MNVPGLSWISEVLTFLTEQIKPQHIVGEDSLDNDDEPRKGEFQVCMIQKRFQIDLRLKG